MKQATRSIHQLIAALEKTTTQTALDLGWYVVFFESPAGIRRVIDPLCRCISNLRLHNENHPLRMLELDDRSELGEVESYGGPAHVFEKLLMAAKQFGIYHVSLRHSEYLPVQVLVHFCHDNNAIKV